MSAFVPSPPESYKVDSFFELVPTTPTITPVVSATPLNKTQDFTKPKLYKQLTRSTRGKKSWTTEQKEYAMEKAQLLGLTKATRFLQIQNQEVYGDLSPSTLQYWLQHTKTQTK
ncbi:hypothetical protein EIN_057980 [Entamoeba invadens IP1]|uniref:hypothetical protein n=1 Tax=Entamoeba invadens IP1 TaxID=370355 RepID=UPI0002C3F8ED|nr:hypothetical protein EIN_057980 [Entamoeba invadens IP1]ELP93383.1 hypothetical protein EIN_057980 [Entamoeba invadens IP1]|eukprot:XP_004260154.1 hypothetical protein EIN_057980 [Entamoeba invadens IP1]